MTLRLALPKGRNLTTALAALRAVGLGLEALDGNDRKLHTRSEADDLEVLLLKDWDVPVYVQYGVADLGVVGSDVLAETDGDLLVPARFSAGGCRLSLIGPEGSLPAAGSQVRLATKYPNLARRLVASSPWGAEVLELKGSVELGPLLALAEVALDIVQTGATLRENGLVELEVVAEVQPCLVANRASYQRHRRRLNDLVVRLEEKGLVFV
ncbi:MAG: ATP phosphoribosyltransferase [Thermoanaerobaculia bacterium]|nr:ATP phosphoribosyltransferase [Thermoanaerobaculia bacterium]